MITRDDLIKLGVTKIIGYNRKSRSDADPEATLIRHKELLEEFLIPLNIPYEICAEIGSSEELEGRIVLPIVQRNLQTKESNAICYVEQSRLSRETGDVKTLFKFFDLNNVIVIDLKNRRIVDFDDEVQDDQRFFESVSDELYIRSTKRVLMRGRKLSARKGNAMIKRMYGYERNAKTKGMDIIEPEAEAIRMMYKMCYDGYGTKLIANKINELGYRSINGNEFTYKQIWKILKSECYKGWAVWNKQSWDKVNGKWKVKDNPEDKIVKVKDAWIPIIDDVFWDEVNTIMEQRSNNLAKKDMASTYWATGLFKCNVCGRKLTVFKKKESLYVRGCQKTDLTTGKRECNNSGGVITNFEKYLIEYSEKEKEDLIDFIKNYSDKKKDLSILINQVKQCELMILDTQKKMDSLMDLLENGTYTIEIFNSRMKIHTDNINNLNVKLKQLKIGIEESDPLKDAIDLVEKFDRVLYGIVQNQHDESARNRLWRSLIKEILWNKMGRKTEEECEVVLSE